MAKDNIRRVPVTIDDVKRIRSGVANPGAQTGPINKVKTAQASRTSKAALLAGGMSRQAGMMIGNYGHGGGAWNSASLPAYRTSYSTGNDYSSGGRDRPLYFELMNEQNGGLIYWPVTLREKYEWYRYWSRTDAYVGRALELLSDLPMSKITLNMPKLEGKSKKYKRDIQAFYSEMVEKLMLFENLQSILWEYNMIGNCYIFVEWDDKKKAWSNIVVLPPEEVQVFQYPFSQDKRIEYRPERLIEMIQAADGQRGEGSAAVFQTFSCQGAEGNMAYQIVDRIPKEIRDMVNKEGCIIMDSDPMSGSFVYQMARRRSPYMDLGVSVLERVLVQLLMKEHYKYTQLSLSSRNMTPKNIINAETLNQDELDDLREQVDLSYLDSEYSIVTNYPVEWNQIGADNRLLDLDREYELIENQIFAGLGVTRELLTGEGTYSGTRITVEIMNTMFLLVRESLQRFVERELFLPVADANGWYEDGSNGVRQYHYPRLGFNRLTIRDNQEVFDTLFQLYQKGSLPIDIIYELLNLDVESMHDRIYEDLFTVKDATFNRAIEDINGSVGNALADGSNIVKKVANYLGLEYKPQEGDEETSEGLGGDFGGDLGSNFGLEEEESDEGDGEEEKQEEEPVLDEDKINDIVEELSLDATDEEIQKAVEAAGVGE